MEGYSPAPSQRRVVACIYCIARECVCISARRLLARPCQPSMVPCAAIHLRGRWLHKRGQLVKSWRLRYFVLHEVIRTAALVLLLRTDN